VDLVHHAEEMAKERGIPRVFALTNRAADFFRDRLGYEQGTPGDLPDSRREQFFASGRDSLVFLKEL
jgi:amino-acid N-acetyltransferase